MGSVDYRLDGLRGSRARAKLLEMCAEAFRLVVRVVKPHRLLSEPESALVVSVLVPLPRYIERSHGGLGVHRGARGFARDGSQLGQRVFECGDSYQQAGVRAKKKNREESLPFFLLLREFRPT